MEKREFRPLFVWVFADGRECWPWRLWERAYRYGSPVLEVFYPGDFWLEV